MLRNFTQFYATKSERDLNLRKEYESQMLYRKTLQAFIDRWRYNANRGKLAVILNLKFCAEQVTHMIAPQAQSRIKILEKVNIFVNCFLFAEH